MTAVQATNMHENTICRSSPQAMAADVLTSGSLILAQTMLIAGNGTSLLEVSDTSITDLDSSSVGSIS